MDLPLQKEFRIGVADDYLRSLTLKVKRHKGDIYITGREITDHKISLHETGITRMAELSEFAEAPHGRRLAIERSRIPTLTPGRFVSVARAVFTTTGEWHTARGEPFGEGGINLPPSEVVVVTFGLTPHHPSDHPDTERILNVNARHVGVIKVNDSKYLTITHSRMHLFDYIPVAKTLLAPSKYTNLTSANRFVPNRDDLLDFELHYQTHMDTYHYWFHHNVPIRNAKITMENHPLTLVLRSGLKAQGVKLHPYGAPRPLAEESAG